MRGVFAGRAQAARHCGGVWTLVILAGVGLLGGQAFAAGITATIDRASASVDEQLLLSVTVDGSQSAEPNLPDLHDFDVQGRGRSTQMQFVNGNLSTAATYSFVLTPKHQGTINIGSATVEIDGRSYKSEPFSVSISNASRPAPPGQGDAPLFITGEVSTLTPYVGQQVVYTWRFYRRAVRVANASVSLPTFTGFATETLGQQREFDTTLKGQRFSVTEIRVALFPQDVGRVVLPASSLQCDIFISEGGRPNDPFNSPFDAFFGRGRQQNRTLRSQPINLEVRALPAPVPPTFHDLIGEFRVDANVAPTHLHVGESTTLTVSVSGSGNVQRISEPTWQSLAKFKVYDDKPVAQISKGGDTLQGSKVFRKALVPTEAGQLRIEPISITYFNPDEQVYKTVSTQPVVLTVEPGANGETRSAPAAGMPVLPSKTDVQVLGDDLLPQDTRLEILDEHRFGPWHQAGLAAGFVLPPLVYLIFALLQRQRSIAGEEHYVAAQRRRTALRKALKTQAEVQERTGGGQHVVAAQTASRGLRMYLGDKCHVEGLALTATDARDMVLRFGGDQALADEVERYLAHCEAAQYGVSHGTVMLYTNLAGELQNLLKKLDRALKV